MNEKETMSRRGFLGALAALGSMGAAACSTQATNRASVARPDPSAAKLPGRGEFVVRGAHILTMDPALGDIPGGDIHVRAGEIVGIAGVAGNGQSELLEAITGIRPRASGEILLNGKPLPCDAAEARAQKLAHVPDERHLVVAIQRPERDQENRRKDVAVDQRHPVAEMQPNRRAELVEQGRHGQCFSVLLVSSIRTSSSDAFST